MTQMQRGPACDERGPGQPITEPDPIVADLTHLSPDDELNVWWRSPQWMGYAAGWDAGYEAAARAFGNAIAEAAAPLPWTAGEVVRRLVGDLSHQTAQCTPRARCADAGGPNGVDSVGSHGWPGVESLSRSERVAAYRRLIGSWDTP